MSRPLPSGTRVTNRRACVLSERWSSSCRATCCVFNSSFGLEEVGEGVRERRVSSAKTLPSRRVSYSFDASDRERRGKEDMRKKNIEEMGRMGATTEKNKTNL
ncbi:Uncharacterized protein APZ42_006489 [Daphnia magna]|uniref:Uncharacterized protein n=1 Tax=Daphnia magna TaxID=35525 RepID=A0A162D3H3_9CRUS|nr:Uncharacterized protein APZ42_006489 [Daphnia magna]